MYPLSDTSVNSRKSNLNQQTAQYSSTALMVRLYYVYDIFDTTSGDQIHQLSRTLENSKTKNVPPTNTNDYSFHEQYVIHFFYPCTYLTTKVLTTTYVPPPTCPTTATTMTSRQVRERNNMPPTVIRSQLFFGYLSGMSLFYPCTYFITNLFSIRVKVFGVILFPFSVFFCLLLCFLLFFSFIVSHELTIFKYHNG